MVVRRKHKGPRRVQKDPLTIPAEIKLEPRAGKLGVHIYRTDRDTPHSLAISFHIDPATVHNEDMCIVVYSTLRKAMQDLIAKPQDIDKDRGKHPSKPRRIPGK